MPYIDPSAIFPLPTSHLPLPTSPFPSPLPMSSFSPTPILASRVLDACADPSLTLRDIAHANLTTVEALSLWLASPEISTRLANLHSITATRTRFLAAAQLPHAIHALAEILKHAKSDLSQTTTPNGATELGNFSLVSGNLLG